MALPTPCKYMLSFIWNSKSLDQNTEYNTDVWVDTIVQVRREFEEVESPKKMHKIDSLILVEMVPKI